MGDNKKNLFDALSNEYDLGSFEDFSKSIEDESNRKNLYDTVKDEYDLGDYDDFATQLGYGAKPVGAEPVAEPVINQPASPKVSSTDWSLAPKQEQMQQGTSPLMPEGVEESKPIEVQPALPKGHKVINGQEYITGFAPAFEQSVDQLYQGGKALAGEVANAVTGSTLDERKAAESLAQRTDENGQLAKEDWFVNRWKNEFSNWDNMSKSERKALAKDYMADYDHRLGQLTRDLIGKEYKNSKGKVKKYNAQKAYDEAKRIIKNEKRIIEELMATRGDVAKAVESLQETASQPTWGDRMIDETVKKNEEYLPTKGLAAELGNLAPQMIPNAVAIGIGALAGGPAGAAAGSKVAKGLSTAANIVGQAGMAALTASTAGQSMADARAAGATTGEAIASGITDGIIEYVTEAIPFHSYTRGILTRNKNKIIKELGDALDSPEGRKELEELVTKANKQLGGKLFSGESAKRYIESMTAEGLSEFAAEALETITPMMYQNPEDYPTLSEVLSNGLEGAKGGILMGGILGGASTGVKYRQNDFRRKNQNYVDIAVVDLGGEKSDGSKQKIVEILGTDADGNYVAQIDDEQVVLPESAVKEYSRFSYEDFKNKEISYLSDMSFDKGYEKLDPNEMADATTAYQLDLTRTAKELGMTEEELENMDGEILVQTTADFAKLQKSLGERKGEKDVDAFVSAQRDKALRFLQRQMEYRGMIKRAQDDIASQQQTVRDEISARTNKDNNTIQAGTLKDNDRPVHIVGGDVRMTPDGKHIDPTSSQDVIVKDDATGELAYVSLAEIKSVEAPVDAQEELTAAENNVAETISTERENAMTGKVNIVVGQQISLPDGRNAIVANTDGTNVIVSLGNDEKGNPILETISASAIQEMADTERGNRILAMLSAEEETEERPDYYPGETVTLHTANGDIEAEVNPSAEPGKYEVTHKEPIDGQYVNEFTKEQLDNMTVSRGDAEVRPASVVANTAEGEIKAAEPTALEQIPVNEDGSRNWTSATPDTVWKALLERGNGSVDAANTVVEAQLAKAKKDLENVNKGKNADMDVDTMFDAINEAQARVNHWEQVKIASEATAPVEQTAPATEEATAMSETQEEIPGAANVNPDVMAEALRLQSVYGDNIRFVTTPEEIDNRSALREIRKGYTVRGWYDPNNNVSYIYLPHIKNAKDLGSAVTHEVLVHRGLTQLMGKEGYKAFCEDVFNNIMTDAQKDYFAHRYNGELSSDKAADEFLAHMAQTKEIAPSESKSLWQKIVDAVRKFFTGNNNVVLDDNDGELSRLLKASYANTIKDVNAKSSDLSVTGLIENYLGVNRPEEENTTTDETQPVESKTDSNREDILLSQRFNPENEDIRFSKIEARDEITYDNFYQHTKATFEKVERPERKPDYISYKFDPYAKDRVSSEYWYGKDDGGEYVVRGSDHWSYDYPVTETHGHSKRSVHRTSMIGTCDWKINIPVDEWAGKKVYGKSYLNDFVDINPSQPANIQVDDVDKALAFTTGRNAEEIHKERVIADMSKNENISKDLATDLYDNGLIKDGGVVMDFEQKDLKDKEFYFTPNELDGGDDFNDGTLFSHGTKARWEEIYKDYDSAKKGFLRAINAYHDRVMADELVKGFVSTSDRDIIDKSGPLRSNEEYIITFDMDTSCPRSFQLLRYVDAIEKKIRRPLKLRETQQLIELMRAYGLSIPCTYCYAENKRQAMKEAYNHYIDVRKAVFGAKTDEEAKKHMYGYTEKTNSLTDASQVVFDEWRKSAKENGYNPSIEELYNAHDLARNAMLTWIRNAYAYGDISLKTSDEKIANQVAQEFSINDNKAKKVIEEIVSEFKWYTMEGQEPIGFQQTNMVVPGFENALKLWREMTAYAKSSSSAKLVERYVPYTGQLFNVSEENKAKIIAMGGLRMHSSNDFRIDYVMDYFQLMADMASGKWTGHTYTKNPIFVKIFGRTGYRINMSLAAYGGENGDPATVRENMDEGFEWNDAKNLRDQYKDAGTMFMATNPGQLQYALDADWIDMIIPFHASSLPKWLYEDIRKWKDYTSVQNESKFSNKDYKDRLKKAGIEFSNKASADEIRELYNQHFPAEGVVENENGNIKAPHFLPYAQEQGANKIEVPGWYDANRTDAENVQRYLELCENWHCKPRFYGTMVQYNGKTVDITEHPGYIKLIKETARIDTPQTPIEFNLDQYDEFLGMTPMEYAMEELRIFAEQNGYENYSEDPYGVVNTFIKDYINYEKEKGHPRHIQWLPEDAREMYRLTQKAEEVPYHPVELLKKIDQDEEEASMLSIVNNNQQMFVSNAEKAVEDLNMGKASGEQWIKAIQGKGGLKASEDKWLGLSEWLGQQDKPVTKEEILKYIDENRIKIEETKYSESWGENDIKALEGKFGKGILDAFDFDTNPMDPTTQTVRITSASEDFYNKNHEDNPLEYDEDGELTEESEERLDAFTEEIQNYLNEGAGVGRPINGTRLEYTTPHLQNKREIALTVPTIDPWNENDRIHFGDAGEGRAISWIRFGETSLAQKETNSRQIDDMLEKKYGNSRAFNKMSDEDIALAEYANYLYRGENDADIIEFFLKNMFGEERAAKIFSIFNDLVAENDLKKNTRVLVIDEIQSKRHQAGREEGYIEDNQFDINNEIEKNRTYHKAISEQNAKAKDKYGDNWANILMDKGSEDPDVQEWIEASRTGENAYTARLYNGDWLIENKSHIYRRLPEDIASTEEEALRYYFEDYNKWVDGVPGAPFEKNWQELAMKRMLRLAAEEGYDKIAWTNGEMQTERYGLDKQLSSLGYSADGNGNYTIQANDRQGNELFTNEYKEDELAGAIGKDLAIRVINAAKENPMGEFKGDDLKIENQGMRGFYDDILPRFMDKYGKKWGVKTQDIELPVGEGMWHSIDVTPEMKESVMEGQPMFSIIGAKGVTNLAKARGTLDIETANAQTALQMEKAGKSPKAIKMATGWEKGKDNRWRYELPDFKLKDIKPFKGHTVPTLDEVIDYPELFTAYPELKDFKLRYYKKGSRLNGTEGGMNWKDKEIALAWNQLSTTKYLLTKSEVESLGETYSPFRNYVSYLITPNTRGRKTLIHEIQHAIQHVEGFAKGTSVSTMNPTEDAVNTVSRQAVKDYDNISVLLDKAHETKKYEAYHKSAKEGSYLDYQKARDEYMKTDEFKTLRKAEDEFAKNYGMTPRYYNDATEDDIVEHFKKAAAFRDYWKHAGEVEARNAEKRADFTGNQRKNIMIFETEDIPREEQLVRFSKVTNPEMIDRLENGPKEDTWYGSMTLLNPEETDKSKWRFAPVKSAKDSKGNMREASMIGQWEQSEEDLEGYKNGKYDLKDTDGDTVNGVNYNPYFHVSSSLMNDQFTGAYNKPNTVVVKFEVPSSELYPEGEPYQAEGAANHVGILPWHSGTINAKLPEEKQRKVALTRWRKPVDIASNEEVAKFIAKKLEEANTAMPWNLVTPGVLAELDKLGAPIADGAGTAKMKDVPRPDMQFSKLSSDELHNLAKTVSAKDYDKFADRIFNGDEATRRKIVDLAKGTDWNFLGATKKYLAGLADTWETTEAEKNIYDKTRELFGQPISDEEARYLLWYKSEREKGAFGVADDVVMQKNLGVGNFKNDVRNNGKRSQQNSDGRSERIIRSAVAGDSAGKLAVRRDIGDIQGYRDEPAARPYEYSLLDSQIEKERFSKVKDYVYAGKEAYASRLMEENRAIGVQNGLSEEQCDALDGMAAARHEMHSNIDGLTKGGKEEIKNRLIAANSKLYESGLKPIKGIPVYDDDYIDIDSIDLMESLSDEYAVPDDRESDEYKEWFNDNYERIYKEWSELNAEIEKYLSSIDDKYNTKYAPTGMSRIMLSKAQDEYNNAVRIISENGEKKKTANLLWRLTQAYTDSMKSLKELQKAVADETGTPVKDFENAYIAENAMSSKNKADVDEFERDYWEPIKKALEPFYEKGLTRDDIDIYLIAKHGLERNEVFQRREQSRLMEERAKKIEELDKADKNYEDKYNAIVEEYGKKIEETHRDYSGLTELTGSKDDYNAMAEDIVARFEAENDTKNLWKKINAATKKTLDYNYAAGILSRENYEEIRDMFDYYVPLRGWNSDVASDIYNYVGNTEPIRERTIKTANGRTSLADSPLATIGKIAYDAIAQSNRNIMKQRFLNLALNHPTDLLTVSEQWYTKNAATGEWEATSPVINDDATPEQVAQAVEEFENKMRIAEEEGNATRKRSGLKLAQHVTSTEKKQHEVHVRRGGKEYIVYINGSPLVAQALNGLTNSSKEPGEIEKAAQNIKNFMAQMFTSKNPAFILANLSRDSMFALSAVYIKENSNYLKYYTSNYAKSFAKMTSLVKKLQNGTLDDSVPVERYFREFVRNGGETGYTNIVNVDMYKKELDKMSKDIANAGVVNKSKEVWNKTWDAVEFMNRVAEDITRFSVYMTSRQMGRTVARSVWDAKEITVNFNKKGSGDYLAKQMNFAYIFFNACVQSAANVTRLVKTSPKKASTVFGTFIASGMLLPLINMLIKSLTWGDDDDESSYWDLPEWVRRNNLCFYIPFTKNGYITIPISQELRPLYGIGEIAYSVMMGKENVKDGIEKGAEGLTGVLPIDVTANGGDPLINVTPTVGQPMAQLIANKDYFGTPIYKDSEYTKMNPEWTKAYKGTSAFLIDGTRWLNKVSGGDAVAKGKVDLNPAIIEHLFEGYLGGLGKTLNRSVKTIGMIWDEDQRNMRNVPVVSSFVQIPDERNNGSQINREYYNLLDEYDKAKWKYDGYTSMAKRDGGIHREEYSKKLEEFEKTEEFVRMMQMGHFIKEIDNLNRGRNNLPEDIQAEIEKKIMAVKKEMVSQFGNK